MNVLSLIAPRSLGTILAVLCIGGAMAYSISQETPAGRVKGRVLLGDSGKPLAHVKVTLTSEDEGSSTNSENPKSEVRRYRAVSDENGEFQLASVSAGVYHVSAATRAHSVDEKILFVSEDETTEVPLKLARSQPDLQVAQQQHEFLPSENVTLPVSGYIDGQKAAGKDTLRVRIFRACLADILRDTKASEALGKVANRYEPVAALPHALLHPSGVEAPQLIATRTMPVRGADIEGFYHERLPLGILGAGLYLVDVAHGNDSICAQMLVSDTALVVEKSAGQLLAYAVDSQSGAPRAAASISVFKAGKTVATARTDKQGLARISLASSEENSGDRLLTLASFGQNEATVGQYDGAENEGHGAFTVHAYTDRPIYRPGGRVSYKGIARRTLDAGLKYGVPVGVPVDVEVRSPDGQRIAQSRLTTNNYGSFHGALELSSEAPTGSYSIVMTMAGEEHTADFNVASYRKPEFSATVVPNEKHYSFGDNVEMMVESAYYFGAPVAGGKLHFTVLRAPDWGSLYAEEQDDSQSDYESESQEEYDGNSGEIVQEGDLKLDENGHAVIRFVAQPPEKDPDSEETFSQEPQDQTYSVSVSVTDAAEREVEANGDVPVTAGDFRLSTQTEGYFASPHKPTAISVKSQDFDGKPVAGKPIVLECSYRHWDAQNLKWTDGPTLQYNATTDAAGAAKIAVTPPREGELYLTAKTRDSKNRDIISTRSLWIAGDKGGNYDAQYNTLSLLTDKKRYQSGETARVLVNAEQSGGTALLTIEGSKLFREWLVPLTHHSTAVRVPIIADYGPNITLAVCMVRDKKFSSSEAPLRVEVPQRQIKVAVQSDRAKYSPGEKVTYRVQTTDFRGKPVPANLSFGVVDEAIYALQEDDPGALFESFYPRNPNSVQTSYSFEPLYLGDVNKAEPNIEARRKFLDTAFWQPDLQTDESGRASVSFALPDNLTTWRATAVAQTLGTSFGRRIQKVVVAKNFFVRLETPRFFTGGDATQITALVHNDTGKDQEATVKIEAQGLTLSGAEKQTISVAAGTVGQIIWPVSTDDAGLGFANIAHFKLSAWTTGDAAKQWMDALETAVPVRPHGRERIENFARHLGNNATITHQLALDTAAMASASRVTVRITPSVSDALVGSLRYLTGFPYGCTEQTMSRFLPDILVQKALRLRGSRDAEAQKLAKQLPKMVRDGLPRLGRFQHESGGWGWWEADDDDSWMTAYVLYGLAQARAEGYQVSDDMLSRGRDAALKMLKNSPAKTPVWQQNNWRNTRAFLLYAVALASPSKEELALIRQYRKTTQTGTLDAQALGYLVLLDKQLNLKTGAWTELEAQLTAEGDQLAYWKGSGHEEWSDWDDKTATAIGLRALLATNPKDERIPAILLWLMTHRENDSWGSTRDTSWVLAAFCDYSNGQIAPKSTNSGTIRVSLNGKSLKNYDLTTATSQNAVSAGEWVLRIPWQKLRAQGNALTLQRTGSGEPIFYSVQVRQNVAGGGILPAVSGSIPNSTLPLTVSREYRRLMPHSTGNGNWNLQSEATNNKLRQGDRIRVRLTFEVPRDLSYVLIEDAFPSGCETTERGSAGEGNQDWDYWWSSTDVRDDRIAFFARHLSRGKHTIEYNLRAQTRGTFSALPTLLQAMYAPSVRAESAETRLNID